MDDVQSETEHLKDLRSIHTERRRWLEKQLANYGFASAPVQMLMELDNTKKNIDKVDNQLLQLGENPFIFTGSDLLERLNNLEQELSQLRQYIARESTPRTLPMEWFKITDNAVIVHDKAYKFTDIMKTDPDFHDYYSVDPREVLDSRIIISLDQTLLALVIGDFIWANFYQQIDQEPRLWRQKRLIVFENKHNEPIFMTGDDKYVHSGPVISFDSKYIALAYCHDWHSARRPHSNLALTLVQDGENDDSYEIVEWLETVAIIDTNTWGLRQIYTEKSTGYGEWANPSHFFDLAFIKNNTSLFCHSMSDAGITRTWEIPLDGSEVIVNSSPKFASEQQEDVQ